MPGSGGPIVDNRALPAATTTGYGSAAMNISTTSPKPKVNVSRSRVVIALRAGTVSSSGPLSSRSTWRSLSSGSSRSTGSSRPISPSSISAIVAAPVTGLVMDAMRNNESRWTGAPPIDSVPHGSANTCSPLATSATSPGTSPFPTC